MTFFNRQIQNNLRFCICVLQGKLCVTGKKRLGTMILWHLTFDPATMAACRTCRFNSRLLNRRWCNTWVSVHWSSPMYIQLSKEVYSVEVKKDEVIVHLLLVTLHWGKSAMAVFCTQEQEGNTNPQGHSNCTNVWFWGRSIIKELQGTLWHSFCLLLFF